MADTNIINLDELKEIMDNDTELICECFDEFRKDWPEAFGNIAKAVEAKDASQLDEAAHKLKGTLRYLAAEQAQLAAYELELAGKENDLEGLDAKLALLEKMGLEVIDYIDNFEN
ncbi:MAG: Hpt domain-containing protein [Desulfobacteraceae bacterium]|nr:Hpt domain-containing protein [Desulfobacteraceae bacterium]